jgi:hypothetical protein
MKSTLQTTVSGFTIEMSQIFFILALFRTTGKEKE